MTQNLGSQDVAWVLRQFDIENYSWKVGVTLKIFENIVDFSINRLFNNIIILHYLAFLSQLEQFLIYQYLIYLLQISGLINQSF